MLLQQAQTALRAPEGYLWGRNTICSFQGKETVVSKPMCDNTH